MIVGKLYKEIKFADDAVERIFTVIKESKLPGKFVVEYENGEVEVLDPSTRVGIERFEYPVTVSGFANVYPPKYGRDPSSAAYLNGLYSSEEAAKKDADESSVLATVGVTVTYTPPIKD